MSEKTVAGLSYAGAGVDIEAQSHLVSKIKTMVKSTSGHGVLAGIGGFGALYELPIAEYPQPVLVSGSDGVGTKLMLANALNCHDTIGIDLVAMCVNDIICHGADPLYFLDYYATGKLDVAQAEKVIAGITQGVQMAGCALIGGETAEMPGMYQADDYDLAGFCVGIVNKPDIISPAKVQVGDALVALASSGPHSNGYSLIRQVIAAANADLSDPYENGRTLGEVLLTPTKIYAKSMRQLRRCVDVRGIAHITGGGLLENVPRMLPQGSAALLDASSWSWPSIFNWLKDKGGIAREEMLRAFNCGVGMVVAVAQDEVKETLGQLTASGETPWVIGRVIDEGLMTDPVVKWEA